MGADLTEQATLSRELREVRVEPCWSVGENMCKGLAGRGTEPLQAGCPFIHSLVTCPHAEGEESREVQGLVPVHRASSGTWELDK